MRCVWYILNLIVKYVMADPCHEIEGIINCVKFIHSSSTRLDTFREYCVLMRVNKMSNIIFDVATKWNATYEMLNNALKFKEVFSRMAYEYDTFVSYFEEEVSGEVNEETTKTKRLGALRWMIGLQVEIEEKVL